jgi:hypothetical protein
MYLSTRGISSVMVKERNFGKNPSTFENGKRILFDAKINQYTLLLEK